MALEPALATLNRRYGREVVRAGAPARLLGLSTGVGELDGITGCQGLPQGRISRLVGEPSSGAFDLGLVLAAEVSRSAPVALVDFTLGVFPGDIEAYGGDLDNCWLVRPRRPVEGWSAARTLAKAGVGMCILVAEDWSRITSGAAPAALLAALSEGVSAGLVLGGQLLPAALRERVCLELECRRLDWDLTHGDVCGLRMEARVTRSHLSAPGARCRLRLSFPRPYPIRAGLVGLAEEEVDEDEGLLRMAGSSR
ncbi:MAG: hypothetical protein ABSF27_06265 [Candidatus Dormibacteria bacterium]